MREKRSRVGRNPQTGESIRISERRVLTFRPSQVLRAEVNGGIQPGQVIVEDDDDDGDSNE